MARRQEIRGEVRGVKVIDDFGHHPTAIAQTLRRCAIVIPGIGFGRSSSRVQTPLAARFFNNKLPKR